MNTEDEFNVIKYKKGKGYTMLTEQTQKNFRKHRILKSLFIMLLGLVFLINPINVQAKSEANLRVSFIDVGQGDCALLESNGKYMLIDGGPVKAGPSVTAYLKKEGIKKLDYILATHQHEDHIGGLIDVMENIKVDNVIMTDTSFPHISYYEFVGTISNKNLRVVRPAIGKSFTLGTATITYVAPNGSNYESYNDNSIVVKVVNGENSFLFTGDAESVSEKEMLEKGYDLKSDVLKVGHHSALTSSTQAFLNAVDPSISVISCGKNMKSGFPRITTMKKLEKTNLYRTDESGTITMHSDGKEITVDKAPYSYAGSNIDILTGAASKNHYVESRNLGNLNIKTNQGSLSLNDIYADEDYDSLFKGNFKINFLADYGISSLGKIEYAFAPVEKFNDVKNVEWLPLDGETLALTDDFVGCIYVKYVNKLGNTVIRKTQGFTLDATAPENCNVVSNLSGIKMLATNAKDTYSKKASGPVKLTFKADYGISGSGKTEYMLVNRGKKFDPKQSWTKGSSVTIKNDFIGRVYVRFTDGAGNVVTKKTTGFSYVSKNPINTKITSKTKNIKFVKWGSKSGKTTVKSPVTLKFSADFGASGKSSIQYMLENKGKKGKWVKKESLTLKKGFSGRVYVRFTDKKGNYVTRNTNIFTVK